MFLDKYIGKFVGFLCLFSAFMTFINFISFYGFGLLKLFPLSLTSAIASIFWIKDRYIVVVIAYILAYFVLTIATGVKFLKGKNTNMFIFVLVIYLVDLIYLLVFTSKNFTIIPIVFDIFIILVLLIELIFKYRKKQDNKKSNYIGQ